MSRLRSFLRSTIAVFVTIALLHSGVPGAVLAGGVTDDDDAGLGGTWHAVFRYEGFPDDYYQVMVFHADGTVTTWDSPRTSVSLGVWKKLRGRGNFAASYDGLFDSDADGSFDRRFRDRLTLHVSDGDTFTATGASDSLTLDGSSLLGTFPTITIRGTRMKVARE